jgi:glycosyltransferase involved in cell wall biosynthesis
MTPKEKPFVSIITPALNAERFIESCMKAVIEQDCPAAEHVIVDGGSSDTTVDIVKEYASRYPHISWISEKDRGQSDAMNKGIAMAKSPIIGFLNVDDFYEPGVLNRVLPLLDDLPEPGLIVGNCNIWRDDGEIWLVNKPARLGIVDLVLGPHVNPYPVNPSQYFYHASLHKNIGPYNVDEHYALDLDFILKAVRVAHLKYVDEVWGNYRFSEGTKTYEDWKQGTNVTRRQSYIAASRASLSTLEKCEFLYSHLKYPFFRFMAAKMLQVLGLYTPLHRALGKLSRKKAGGRDLHS